VIHTNPFIPLYDYIVKPMDEIEYSINRILEYEQVYGSWNVDEIHPSVVPLLSTLLRLHFIERRDYSRNPHYHTTKKAENYVGGAPMEYIRKPTTIPSNIFDVIIGLDDVKKLLYRAIYAPDPVHVFIIGDYSSAKSTILFCLSENLPNVVTVDTALATKLGVGKLLEQYRPDYLLMDEFDKMKSEDYNVLLTVMASQQYIRTTSRGQVSIPMPTKVFAAGNAKNVPESVLSRFDPFIIELPEYNRADALHVMKNILLQRGVSEEMASHIARVVVDDMNDRNPRAAINLANTCKTKEQVDETVEVLKRHRK